MDLVSGLHRLLIVGAHVCHDAGIISRVFRVQVAQFQIAVFRHETYNEQFREFVSSEFLFESECVAECRTEERDAVRSFPRVTRSANARQPGDTIAVLIAG